MKVRNTLFFAHYLLLSLEMATCITYDINVVFYVCMYLVWL